MTVALEFALFDTAIGRCGVAWSARGIVGVQLPEGGDAATRDRLRTRFPGVQGGEPPSKVQRAIADMQALLKGDARALDHVELDMQGVPPFHQRVYAAARAIPPGQTSSYGELATRAGAPGGARAVGQALGRNPFAIVVPCHRVLAAGGRTGGFSANGGVATKLRMLRIEGARRPDAKAEFEGDGAFAFDPAAALEHLRAADAKLGRLIDSVGPFRMQLKQTPSIFGALVEAIVYQQLTGKAAATIHSRLCALFPKAHQGPTAEQILRASEEHLRGAGLSRAKAASLKDLAAKAKARVIPTLREAHAMNDEELVERLTEVRGIGRWTVEMLLMFRLGRPDVLPVDDYGIRKGFGVAFGAGDLPPKQIVAERGERWKPYRTVASWYLWRAAEKAKRLTNGASERNGKALRRPKAAKRKAKRKSK